MSSMERSVLPQIFRARLCDIVRRREYLLGVLIQQEMVVTEVAQFQSTAVDYDE
jgi:hypothetical protein